MTHSKSARDFAQRLCVSLIADFQAEQIRQGRLPRSALIHSVLSHGHVGDAESLELTEETLGLDSLKLLDLLAVLTRYFRLQATGVEDYFVVRRTLGDWVELLCWHLAEMGEAATLTFATSGSSGTPKFHTHSVAQLGEEVDTIAAVILPEVASTARVLSLVAPHHIYGCIWGALLPKLTDRSWLDLNQSALTAVARVAEPGDVVLGTPYQWEKLSSLAIELPPSIVGISSGGPTTAATWAAADHLGLSAFCEVYGSTETAGLGHRFSQSEPFQLMRHLHRQGDRVVRSSSDACCDIQDHLDWPDDSHFWVAGRKDTVVQVAGTNVCLAQVKRALEETGLIEEASVRSDGERLKAFVVPRDEDVSSLEVRLRSAVLHLPAPARPDRFTFGPALPKSDVGKLCDW